MLSVLGEFNGLLGACSPFSRDARRATFPCPGRGAPMGIEEKPAASVVTTSCGVDAMRGRGGRRPGARREAACKLSVVIAAADRCWLMAGFSANGSASLLMIEMREGSCDEVAASSGPGIDGAPEPRNAEARSRPPTRASAQSATVLPSIIILAAGCARHLPRLSLEPSVCWELKERGGAGEGAAVFSVSGSGGLQRDRSNVVWMSRTWNQSTDSYLNPPLAEH
jgi:hypothetical protein